MGKLSKGVIAPRFLESPVKQIVFYQIVPNQIGGRSGVVHTDGMCRVYNQPWMSSVWLCPRHWIQNIHVAIFSEANGGSLGHEVPFTMNPDEARYVCGFEESIYRSVTQPQYHDTPDCMHATGHVRPCQCHQTGYSKLLKKIQLKIAQFTGFHGIYGRCWSTDWPRLRSVAEFWFGTVYMPWMAFVHPKTRITPLICLSNNLPIPNHCWSISITSSLENVYCSSTIFVLTHFPWCAPFDSANSDVIKLGRGSWISWQVIFFPLEL